MSFALVFGHAEIKSNEGAEGLASIAIMVDGQAINRTQYNRDLECVFWQ